MHDEPAWGLSRVLCQGFTKRAAQGSDAHRRITCELPLQVEERLRFYEDGVAPTKNLTAMQDALRTIAETAAPAGEDGAEAGAAEPKKGKVRKHNAIAGFDVHLGVDPCEVDLNA